MFSSIIPKDYVNVFIALTKSFTSLVSSWAQTNQLCDGQATRAT